MLSLVRPTFSVVFDADGRSNWAGLLESLARALAAERSALDIILGTAHRRAAPCISATSRAESTRRLTDVDLSLAWPSISRSFGATGRFVVARRAGRCERDAQQLLRGAHRRPLRLEGAIDRRAAEAVLRRRLEPAAFDEDRGHARSGRSVPARDDALGRAEAVTGGGFGRFSLKAQTNAVGGSVALTNVSLELDGNAAEGVLTFSGDGRQNVQGTLAAEGLDLTPYVSTFRLIAANEREWNRVPIAIDGLASFDLDLRLSAARITIAERQARTHRRRRQPARRAPHRHGQ